MTEGAPTDDQMTDWMKLLQPRGRAQAVGGVDDSAIVLWIMASLIRDTVDLFKIRPHGDAQ